ncbi:MAG: TauD/TfdA family dioxygenase [Actinomycetota bacterium]|nr:TauD/TfdA family dioxygenase [Actinomycetota bacterium]
MPGAAVLEIEPLDGTTFGAVVTGVRLADLDDATWEAIRAAWLEHALLIFPNQFLTRDEQVAFAKRFGDIELLGGKEIVPITNVRADGSFTTDENTLKLLKGNEGWHPDSTYMPLQAKGAVFTAEVVPPTGGETGWADMRAAYDALDDTTRARVEGLSAYHSLRYSQSKVAGSRDVDGVYAGYGLEGHEPPLRPLVKVHPETGRRSLLIGRHAYGIPGMDPAESERFLDGLVEQACQPPRVHHHHWTPGDAVVWDNRCLLHRARPWDLTYKRVMWHSRIAGEVASELVGAAT